MRKIALFLMTLGVMAMHAQDIALTTPETGKGCNTMLAFNQRRSTRQFSAKLQEILGLTENQIPLMNTPIGCHLAADSHATTHSGSRLLDLQNTRKEDDLNRKRSFLD